MPASKGYSCLSIEKGSGQGSERKPAINVDSPPVDHRARDWSEKAKESQPARGTGTDVVMACGLAHGSALGGLSLSWLRLSQLNVWLGPCGLAQLDA
jgi:hypothetical protein